jgi:DNA-binding CsgD family transcriptional regulator
LPTLFGRQDECERIAGWLEAVRGGQGGCIVIRGEPGIGKSVLLDHAVRSARGFRVARAAGVESELELPYAVLHQVCAPMLDRVERLPGPRRNALGVAFGLKEGAAPERLLVGLAVLALLAEAAAEQPTICVIDDGQWLDRASAQGLAFVAHRVAAGSLGLIFATRAASDELSGLPAMTLRGLRHDESHALLGSVLHAPVDEDVRTRIVVETRGNPLALLELPRTSTPAELAGGFGLPDAAPLSGRIEASFSRRVGELPSQTQLLLLLAAADPLGDPVLMWQAAKRLGIPHSAAADAESAGLLAVAAQVTFHHPLVRSAVYRAAPKADRQAVHQALAMATDPETDPDRRAWHRAQAADGPDEAVADELERSAGRARARGGIAAAAAFLERAATLTLRPVRRTDLTLAAAKAKHQSGAYDSALRLLAAADAAASSKLQLAQAALLRGQVMFALNRADEALTLLFKAARLFEPLDIEQARDAYLLALASALLAGRLNTVVNIAELARAARAVPAPTRRPRACDLLLDGLAALLEEGCQAGAPLLKEAFTAFLDAGLPAEDGLSWLWLTTHLAGLLWDDESRSRLSALLLRSVRVGGMLSMLPGALNIEAGTFLLAGDLTRGGALAQEANAIGTLTGSGDLPFAELMLAALRGGEAEVTELAAAAARTARQRSLGMGLTVAQWMHAVLYNGLGRYERALAAAQQASEDHRTQRFGSAGLVELVEAASRTGNDRLARRALSELSAATESCRTDWAAGITARCAALVETGADAERHYRTAITCLERTSVRTDLARAHLLYGEWLRRERRAVDARVQLRLAHGMFKEFGMEAFADRAFAELRATGERARRRTDAAGADLTPKETQIALLVAEGETNAEIAARLYISTNTVDYHLRKAFRKLGVRSRTQLARHVHRFGASPAESTGAQEA